MRKVSILFLLVLISCAVKPTATPALSVTPTATIPAVSHAPTPEPVLPQPYGVLVDDDQEGIALVDSDGQTVMNFDAPSETPFQPGSAHLGGSFSGQGFPPLIYLGTFEGHNALIVNRFNGFQVCHASDFLFQFAGAPAQPILAVSEPVWLKGNDVQNNVFLGTLEEIRQDPSANVILVDDGGMAYIPVAVTSENGKPLGFFFTKSAKGSRQAEALFPVQHGLHYFDAAGRTLPQMLEDERLFCGISPSLVLYASTDPANRSLRVHDTGRSSYRSLGLETESDLGAGYVVFSPNDQVLAWMEAGTDEHTSTGYATLIKISSVSGTAMHTLPSTLFDRLVGVTSIRVMPAGFLDVETLLVQITTEDQQNWLATVDVPGGDIMIFHAGTFLAFAYP